MSDVSGTFDFTAWETDDEGEDTPSHGSEPDLYDPDWKPEE